MQLIVEALELGQEDLKQNPKKAEQQNQTRDQKEGEQKVELIINSLLDAFLNRKHFWNAIFWQSQGIPRMQNLRSHLVNSHRQWRMQKWRFHL